MSNKLSRSALFYRKNKSSRIKKAKKDKEINAREEQKAKRRELEKKRVAARKRGADTSKTDYDHAVGRRVPKSVNRGRKNGTKGDRRARGKKK